MDSFYIQLGVFIIAFGMLAWRIFEIEKKVKTLFGGLESAGEEFTKSIIHRIGRAEAKLEELEPRLNLVEQIAKVSVQKVGFLRFNPFQDTGGDQSFIATFLDGKNDGVLISSLYTREGVRIYAKQVERGEAKHPLSQEEKQVLEQTLRKN